MTHELGLGLQTDKRPGAYAALAREAEDSGFDVVTAYNDLWYQPSLPALLEVAAATERVRVGASCLNAYATHPVELAGQVAALDLASDGRAFLGLAAGAWLDDLGLEQRRPARTIAEAWEIVSALLAGDRSGFEGEVFRLAPGVGLEYERRRQAVPLLVGTWSPRLTAFAAARADELKLGGSASPAFVRLARERLASARTAVVAGAVTVVDLERERARAHARRRVAGYVEIVAPFDPTFEADPELIARIAERLAAGDPDGAGALLSDDVLDRYALSGTPADVAEHAAALFDAGARRVDFGTPYGLDERTGIELLVSQVAPRLRS